MASRFTTELVVKAKDRFSSTLNKATGQVGRLSSATRGLNSQFNNSKLQNKFQGVAKRAVQVGGALLATGAVLSIKKFADYEKALVGVSKTTDIEGKALEDLGKGFTDLSTKIPLSGREFAELGIVAGEMGTRGVDNILAFTSTMGKLATATDLAGQEGARQMGTILRLTGEDGKDFGKNFKIAGDVITELGNKTAPTEQQIARMGNQLARSIGKAGGSTTDVLGLSSAFLTLGFRAEEAGGVTTRAMESLEANTKKGSQGFGALVKLTGIAPDSLRGAFKKDPTKFFIKFLGGLKKAKKDGVDVVKGLAEVFDLSGIRVTDLLGSASNNIDLLERSLDIARKGVGSGSLDKEVDKALTSTSAKMKLFANRMENSGVAIGKSLAPGVIAMIDAFTPFTEFLASGIGSQLEIIFSPHKGIFSGQIGDAFAFSNIVTAIAKNLEMITGMKIPTLLGGTGGFGENIDETIAENEKKRQSSTDLEEKTQRGKIGDLLKGLKKDPELRKKIRDRILDRERTKNLPGGHNAKVIPLFDKKKGEEFERSFPGEVANKRSEASRLFNQQNNNNNNNIQKEVKIKIDVNGEVKKVEIVDGDENMVDISTGVNF